MPRARTAFTKRARVGRLIDGGSGDINPQMLFAAVTETSANTFTQVEIPVPRFHYGRAGSNTAQILELLKVRFFNAFLDGATGDQFSMQVTKTSQTAMLSPANPNLIARVNMQYVVVTSGSMLQKTFEIDDLTDGAGHGLLVGGNSVFVGIEGTSLAAAKTAQFQLQYRMKNINIQEYVGLLTN